MIPNIRISADTPTNTVGMLDCGKVTIHAQSFCHVFEPDDWTPVILDNSPMAILIPIPNVKPVSTLAERNSDTQPSFNTYIRT